MAFAQFTHSVNQFALGSQDGLAVSSASSIQINLLTRYHDFQSTD